MAQKQYKVNGYFVKVNLEQDPKSAPLRKATAMFFKALKEAQGDEKRIKTIYGNHHTTFLVDVENSHWKVGANYTKEGNGFVDEGLNVDEDILQGICHTFEPTLFDLSLKEN